MTTGSDLVFTTDGADLWTASVDLILPGAQVPEGMFSMIMTGYLIAGALVIVGAVASLSDRRKVGYSITGGAVTLSVLCFSVVHGWGYIVGSPAREVTAAYAYTGDRLTTVIRSGSGVIESDVAEGQIVQADQVELVDGRTFVVVHFGGGETRQMALGSDQIADLVRVLERAPSSNVIEI